MANNITFVASIPAHELISKFEKALRSGKINARESDRIRKLKDSLVENDNEVLFIREMK